MGTSSYFIYISHDPKRENALIVYSFQLFINFCWPLFFLIFNYFLSLMILIALILTVIYMLIIFKKLIQKVFI